MTTARKHARRAAHPSDPWMTLGQAATALRLSRQTVLARALQGELVAQVIANRTFVKRDSVEALAAQLAGGTSTAR